VFGGGRQPTVRGENEQAVQVGVGDVLEEAAAILNGRMVQRYGPGETAPGWARLNELAHADWDDLTRLADPTGPTSVTAWDGAVKYLAAELISAAGSPAGLRELQRSRLIPLELNMLALEPRAVTPTELVQVVRHELAQERARRSHPSTG
jgi:hypothetical protein